MTGAVNWFYEARPRATATHLALRWKGRVRYIVPRHAAGQRACWKVFHPGSLGIPLRIMARMPGFFSSTSCTEGAPIACIRKAIGRDTGLSCCSAGAAGVWCKDTLLILDSKTDEPACIVKVGEEDAVGRLLQNEADWLTKLRAETTLADHIPQLVAHGRTGDLCFVAQTPLSGSRDFALGEAQIAFLRKLQAYSLLRGRYRDSRLCRTLNARVKDLSGRLPAEWSQRIEKAMLHIECSLGDSPVLLVAAHNDFTPWNVRIREGRACVFDWEFADHEQLPLFDPLHYILGPMALHARPAAQIQRKMYDTLGQCRKWLGAERCYKPEIQALAYMLNLCTLYQWADRGTRNSHPTLVSYAKIIDYLSTDSRTQKTCDILAKVP